MQPMTDDVNAILGQLEQVVPFLSPSQRPDVRKTALGLIASFTTDESIALRLSSLGAVPHLVQMVCGDHAELAVLALKSLINITAVERALRATVDAFAVERCLDILKDAELRDRHEFALMLLSNLSKDEAACKTILQADTPLQGLHVLRLLNLFAKHPPANDIYARVADIMTNLTQIEAGRLIFLDKKRGIMKFFVNGTRATNVIRRLGVLRVIRNCCYEVDHHEDLLSEDLGLLSALVIPLAGPEPIDDEVNAHPYIISKLSLFRDSLCFPFDRIAKECCPMSSSNCILKSTAKKTQMFDDYCSRSWRCLLR